MYAQTQVNSLFSHTHNAKVIRHDRGEISRRTDGFSRALRGARTKSQLVTFTYIKNSLFIYIFIYNLPIRIYRSRCIHLWHLGAGSVWNGRHTFAGRWCRRRWLIARCGWHHIWLRLRYRFLGFWSNLFYLTANRNTTYRKYNYIERSTRPGCAWMSLKFKDFLYYNMNTYI